MLGLSRHEWVLSVIVGVPAFFVVQLTSYYQVAPGWATAIGMAYCAAALLITTFLADYYEAIREVEEVAPDV